MTEQAPLIKVQDLSVSFGSGEREVKAVKTIAFDIKKGETVALVGESGSGKSVSALSILQLLPYPLAHHPSGSICFNGEELIGAKEGRLQEIRGNRISMIFQEPLTSLNPLHSIGKQICETLLLHKHMSARDAKDRAIELLTLVGMEAATSRLSSLPHEFSGGQRQRIMIAMALANEPDLLIADEPTTALDVTIQAQILKLLKELQEKLGMALLLITHDLGIVRRMADRVNVMCNGEIVEANTTAALFDNPTHAYTQRLLASEPKGQPDPITGETENVIAAHDVKVWFPIKKGLLSRTVDHVKAVDGLDLHLKKGHTIGIVGESGSGKTTLGNALMQLTDSEGSIFFCGTDIQGMSRQQIRPLRREMQMVFQDPFGSLSPRMSVSQIIEEGLLIHGIGKSYDERRDLISATMIEVGLDPAQQDRYPHEFSGGQRQRISIARALILKPKLIVLDEPTSALDMSVQAQIVDLLRDLQKKYNLTYLFISHDLKVVRALSHEVIVMRQGRVVEQGAASDIFDNPQDPYTKALMAAAFHMQADESGVVSM